MSYQFKSSPDQSLTRRQRTHDSTVLAFLEQRILQVVGGRASLERELPMIARQAIEEVVDWPRTGRRSTDELNSAERAYLGTKLEILFKHWLGAGIAETPDMGADSIGVGIKHVFGTRCWISRARVEHPLLVIQTELVRSRISLAAIVARSSRVSLNPRRAALDKRAANSECSVRWLCTDCEIRKSAVFTEMMLMHRKRAEQERTQLRLIMESIHTQFGERKN